MVLPQIKTENDKIRIYFWNPAKDKTLYIDNMNIEFISLSGDVSG